MKDFFFAHLTIELHFSKETFEDFMIPLIGLFPESTYIIAQLALAYYSNAGKRKERKRRRQRQIK